MTVKKPADLAAAVVLLIGTGFAYNESRLIDTSLNYALGPLFVPYLLLGAIALLSVILALQSISFKQAASASAPRPGIGIGINAGTALQVAFIAWLIAYLVMLPHLGYVPSTILFLSGGAMLLGDRKPKTVAIAVGIAAVVTVALWFLFGRVLLLFLP
jgi:hypothetical protein